MPWRNVSPVHIQRERGLNGLCGAVPGPGKRFAVWPSATTILDNDICWRCFGIEEPQRSAVVHARGTGAMRRCDTWVKVGGRSPEDAMIALVDEASARRGTIILERAREDWRLSK